MTTLFSKRYMRNPLYVHAEQVTARNMAELAKACGGTIETDDNAKAYIKVKVLRPMKPRDGQAYVSDWILKTASGYKVYGRKAFVSEFIDAPEVDTNPTVVRTDVPLLLPPTMIPSGLVLGTIPTDVKLTVESNQDNHDPAEKLLNDIFTGGPEAA